MQSEIILIILTCGGRREVRWNRQVCRDVQVLEVELR
jgi:hypothetical protein